MIQARIFAVDDLPENLQVLRLALRGMPWELETAVSGEDALQKLAVYGPDIILMDIQMPGIDGFETVARLREMPHLKETPVLFLSALQDSAVIVRCFDAGAVDYVTKPFRRPELRARIRTQLEIRRLQASVRQERDRFASILGNILPDSQIASLKAGVRPAPHVVDDATVIMTDFRNFTGITRRIGAEAATTHLNHLFYAFDEIVEAYGLERIKTIGDGYLAVGGVNRAADDVPARTVAAGLAMQAYVKAYNGWIGETLWDLRVGIHAGPLVGGIVGFQKIAFDVWGDAVNMASRLQSVAGHEGVCLSHELWKRIEARIPDHRRFEADLHNLGSQTVIECRSMDMAGLPPCDPDAIRKRFNDGDGLVDRLFRD